MCSFPASIHSIAITFLQAQQIGRCYTKLNLITHTYGVVLIISESRWRSRERKYYSQSVLGSMVNPRETPQKPGKVAIAVALGLFWVIKSIKQRQTLRRLSAESATLLRVDMAIQQGDPGIGSGVPSFTKLEHDDTNAVTVLQSVDESAGIADSTTTTAIPTATCLIICIISSPFIIFLLDYWNCFIFAGFV